jgi:hypothetical protein
VCLDYLLARHFLYPFPSEKFNLAGTLYMPKFSRLHQKKRNR